MRDINWFSGATNYDKQKHMCQTIMKDIRISIGDCYRNEENEKMMAITDFYLKGRTNYAILHIHFSEPLNQHTEWGDEDINTRIDVSQKDDICKNHIERFDQAIEQYFPYTIETRRFISVFEKDMGKVELKTEYFLLIDVNDRIFPLTQKIRKSLLRMKEFYLKTR